MPSLISKANLSNRHTNWVLSSLRTNFPLHTGQAKTSKSFLSKAIVIIPAPTSSPSLLLLLLVLFLLLLVVVVIITERSGGRRRRARGGAGAGALGGRGPPVRRGAPAAHRARRACGFITRCGQAKPGALACPALQGQRGSPPAPRPKVSAAGWGAQHPLRSRLQAGGHNTHCASLDGLLDESGRLDQPLAREKRLHCANPRHSPSLLTPSPRT